MTPCPRCRGQMLHVVDYDAYPGAERILECFQCGYNGPTRAPQAGETGNKGREWHNYRRAKRSGPTTMTGPLGA